MEEKLPEIYTEEVQEILSRPPSVVIRTGTTLMLIVVVLLIVGSWFIRYPDIIFTQITVSTTQVPASLVAKTSGKITHLFVSNNQKVTSGQVLAVIENPAQYNHVLLLDSLLTNFNADNDSCLTTISDLNMLLLGDLQADFSIFQKAISDYVLFKNVNLLARKISSLQRQLAMTDQYYNRLSEQSNLQGEDVNIALEEFRRDSVLYSQQVISPADFGKSKAAYIQRKQSYMSTRTNLSSVQIQKAQLEQQIVENQLTISDETRQYLQAIQQSYTSLTNSVFAWKNTYLLIAPIDGKVTFTTTREVNQNVVSGDIVMTVVPLEKSELTGNIILPMQGAGKVKIGQSINIKFDNYPYMEFGMVKAQVKNISLVPTETNYIVEVSFPDGLITNYGKTLAFSQQMSGTAEIVTEDLRLIERFLNPIKSLVKRNTE